MKILSAVAFAITMLFTMPAHTQDLASHTSTIIKLGVYTEFGNGDVLIYPQSALTGCEAGFWLGGNDPSLETSLSFLLMARAMGSQVELVGDKDKRWAGSSGNFCHLFVMNLF